MDVQLVCPDSFSQSSPPSNQPLLTRGKTIDYSCSLSSAESPYVSRHRLAPPQTAGGPTTTKAPPPPSTQLLSPGVHYSGTRRDTLHRLHALQVPQTHSFEERHAQQLSAEDGGSDADIPRHHSDLNLQLHRPVCQHTQPQCCVYHSYNRVSSNPKPSSRKPRLDTIGVDFMRVNGAMRGFSQLKRAESFKNANNSSLKSWYQRSATSATPHASLESQNSTGMHRMYSQSNNHCRLSSSLEEEREAAHNHHPHSHSRLEAVTGTGGSTVVDLDLHPSRLGGHTTSAKDNEDDLLPGSQAEQLLASAALNRRRHALKTARNQMVAKNIGYRLGRRKKLFDRRRRMADYSLCFAVFGFVVMVIEFELQLDKTNIYSLLLKTLLTISTVMLVSLIIAFHVIEIKLASFDDAIEDWRIAITWQRISQVVLEVGICAVHPLPGHFTFNWHIYKLTKSETSSAVVPLDTFLALPMFARLYLVFRVIMLHSRLITDTGSRSIGAMNKVSFDTPFILKTLMTLWPGRVLACVIGTVWIICGWMMRACEGHHDDHHKNLLNCLWLIAVTFLSIGYGDIVPHTYCGKSIAIFTGVMGSACTALVVAVFARKLELSKAEKHVIQFMMENKLSKNVEYYAANVLRETWLIYKHTKLVRCVNPTIVRHHQRKFLHAIHGMRKLKIEQRKLQDRSNSLVDLAKTQNFIYESVTSIQMEQICFRNRMESIENSLATIQNNLHLLPQLVKGALSNQRVLLAKDSSE